jgi:short subunit dehydrogenase-like uncharacterized protein
VLLGRSGVFGSAVAASLRERGVDPLTPPHAQVDVEKGETLLASLQPRDVVIDACGPFHLRSTTLVEVAIKIGVDVIDLSDNLDYALAINALDDQLQRADVSVLTSCSAVSAVTAAVVRKSNIDNPVRVSVCLLPASRETSSPSTAASLLRSLAHGMRVLRDGRLTAVAGWSSSRSFRLPNGRRRVRGYLAESADAVTLPRVWPSLRTVEFMVDTQVTGLNPIISAGLLLPYGGSLMERLAPAGLGFARLLGSRSGGYVVEVEAGDGRVATTALMARRRSYITAAMPATLAAISLARGGSLPAGVVPPDRHCDPDELFSELRKSGIQIDQ